MSLRRRRRTSLDSACATVGDSLVVSGSVWTRRRPAARAVTLGDDRPRRGAPARRVAASCGLCDRARRRGHAEDRAALELDAEVEPAEDGRRATSSRIDAGDARTSAPAPDEVVGDLAAVELAAELAEAGHQASLPRACGAGCGRRLLAPRRSGSRPDHLLPLPKNAVRANRVTIGLVNKNTTKTSMSVVSPRVKAKPRDGPDRDDVEHARRRASTRRRPRGSCAGPAPSRSRRRRAGLGPRAPRRVCVRSRR